MDMEKVAPELREAYQRRGGGRIDPRSPVIRFLGTRLVRLMRPGLAEGVRALNRRIGGVPCRVYAPAEPRSDGAVLWIHGGGLVIGSPNLDDRVVSAMAAESGVRVVSVDYRLAPRHPFPAAIDDVAAAFHGVARLQGVDPARIVVAGASAGAGLAAALAQRLLDEGGPQPIGQALIYPMLDDRTAADRRLDAIAHLGWDNDKNAYGWGAYLRRTLSADPLPPYAAAARRDDLAGLPPAYLSVGDIDLFHDEDVAYAERLRAAGVPVDLRVVPGAPHGFEAIAPESPQAVASLAAIRAWIGDRLAAAPSSAG